MILAALAWSVALNGPLLLAAWWVARAGLRQPAGWPALLAAGVLAWAWAASGVVVLGALHALTRPGLLAWSLLGLGVGAGLRWRFGRGPVESTKVEQSGWSWPTGVALGLSLLTVAALGLPSLLGPVKVISDGPIYHLFFAARWWKAGALELIPIPFGESAATYFPAAGDAWFAWLMVGAGGDVLAKVGQAPFLLLLGSSLFAGGRQLGLGAAASALAACLVVTSSPLLVFTFEGNVDTIATAAHVVSFSFLLRYRAGGGIAAAALCGLAAGGAWATKPTGVVFALPWLVVAGAVVLAGKRPDRWRALAAIWLTPWILIGPWIGRNVWLTGNPLYPADVALGGMSFFPGWFDRAAMTNSPYYLPVGDVNSLVDMLLTIVDPRLAPIWIAALVGIGGRSGQDRRGFVLAWAIGLMFLALAWLVIPYRTQQRFAFPAVAMMAWPVAALIDRWRWLRVATAVLLVLHLVTPQGWPAVRDLGKGDAAIPWDRSRFVPNALAPPLGRIVPVPSLGSLQRPRPSDAVSWGVLGVAIVPAIAAGVIGGRIRIEKRIRFLAWSSLIAAVGVLAARVAPWQDEPRLRRYPLFPDYAAGWLAWERLSGLEPVRVAYSGTNIPYYLMGAGMRHTPIYIRVDGHSDRLWHDDHRIALDDPSIPDRWPDPRPTWERIAPDFPAWYASLLDSRASFVVVCRADPAQGQLNPADSLGFPIERGWIESHPELFRPVYGVAEGEREMRIYRIIPGSDPARSR